MIKTKKANDLMTTANLTSMTDVLLTLLIMFMIAETASASFGFNMKLPQVITAKKPDDPTILVTLTQDRKLFVTTSGGDQELQRERLTPYLARLKSQQNYNQLVIRADRQVKYRDVIAIMDDAKQAGIEDISLATEN